jgi:hypothetical protein
MARLLADHKADVEESAKLIEIRARYDVLLKEMDLYEEQDRACHKRKISAAIPANERPNADGDVVVTGEADEADEANGMIIAAARGNESKQAATRASLREAVICLPSDGLAVSAGQSSWIRACI